MGTRQITKDAENDKIIVLLRDNFRKLNNPKVNNPRGARIIINFYHNKKNSSKERINPINNQQSSIINPKVNNHKSKGQQSPINSLELIFKELHARRGIDFSRYRESTIKRRLARRMAMTNCDNYSDYFYCLEKDTEEYGRLFRDLTIKVSRFFRNRAVFEILSDKVFPDIMSAKESKNDNTFRIWCAGCSFGEEVYSVAITLVEYLKKNEKKIDDYNISIFGTDIDGEALKIARAGIYDVEAVKEIKKEILYSYFLYNHPIIQSTNYPNSPSYLVVGAIKNMVSFSEHDLASETKISPPAGIVANYDLILCRNLLIYFSESLQKGHFQISSIH